ncbi:amidase [Nocardia sp. CS682]|uniref:amidase n=1 Tax=Nocardia sp. CS682 TaxID=1047172 RepID=UPI0010750847|nr:amidase family protein [Nocardia sp. CS682]QBS42572.1 amidase [Nocardia sp. CS682]
MQIKATAVADGSADTETSGTETAADHPAVAQINPKQSTLTQVAVAQSPAPRSDVEASAPAQDSPLGACDQIAVGQDLTRGPATAIAAGVRDGSLTATEVVEATVARIVAEHRNTNAFSVIRTEKARSEAAALEQRADLDVLPLAGVPIAIKHNIAVAGETMRSGSAATDARPVADDHAVVRRLRAAGAVIVGLTTVPELGLWGTTDTPDRITGNPWNVARSAGGSSGGAAAAVAAGLVPIAHGNDGLGSLRIPAACCGVFGIKPGRYTVPAEIGVDSWSGMIENGVLATTVGDAALALSVLAARPDLAEVDPPGRLRIGLAVAPPYRFFRVDRQWTNAARTAASVAAAAGHLVEPTTLPYGDALISIFLRWLAFGSRDAAVLPNPERLQPRTRRHLALGRLVQRLRLVRPAQVDRVEARLLEYFERYDVVITPTLAGPPPKARAWHHRGWLANVLASSRFSPFTPLWNLVGWPAASIPMGMHADVGTPVAAQLAGPPGSESTLLRLSAQLESLHPWRRTIN